MAQKEADSVADLAIELALLQTAELPIIFFVKGELQDRNGTKLDHEQTLKWMQTASAYVAQTQRAMDLMSACKDHDRYLFAATKANCYWAKTLLEIVQNRQNTRELVTIGAQDVVGAE